jgi:hypothetical protein
VQRQFQQAVARSAISHLVQKFELTGSVCDKKDTVGKHRSAGTEDNVAHVHEVLLWSTRKYGK